MKNIKDLSDKLSQLKAIRSNDHDSSYFHFKIEVNENTQIILFDLVLDLKTFLQKNEVETGGKISEKNIEMLRIFINDLTTFIRDTRFIVTKETKGFVKGIISMLFGIASFYKAFLDIANKNIETFNLCQAFKEMEIAIFECHSYETILYSEKTSESFAELKGIRDRKKKR